MRGKKTQINLYIKKKVNKSENIEHVTMVKNLPTSISKGYLMICVSYLIYMKKKKTVFRWVVWWIKLRILKCYSFCFSSSASSTMSSDLWTLNTSSLHPSVRMPSWRSRMERIHWPSTACFKTKPVSGIQCTVMMTTVYDSLHYFVTLFSAAVLLW